MDIVFSYNFLDSKLASLDYSETLSGCQTLQCIENISRYQIFCNKRKINKFRIAKPHISTRNGIFCRV